MHDTLVLLQYGAILALAGFAFWRGAGPEKIANATMATVLLADLAYHALFASHRTYSSIDVPHLAIDMIGFVGFGILAMRANRIYPLCLLGAQIFVMIVHFDRELVEGMLPRAYAFMIRMPSYLQVATLAIGLALHIRREMKYGAYRSWRTSSSRFWAIRTMPPRPPTR